jgi:N-dimethylarginine dimethylaminohydrolase
MNDTMNTAAYGGEGWSPRTMSMRQEIGRIWADCGINSEWSPLKAVLLHRPGVELSSVPDPNLAQMLEQPDFELAQAQHDALAQAYRDAGVEVYYVEPDKPPPPNLLFAADLMWMTPEGVILSRPASTVRAGEERWVARRLADLGIPLVRSVRGMGTFEGADAMWVNEGTVLIGRGLRTNADGTLQVRATLAEMGVTAVIVDLPFGTMHLMGELRLVDHDLAYVWPGRVAVATVETLRAHGYTVHFLPDEEEAANLSAFNFVVLGPRQILMPAGCPRSQAAYEAAGITCHTVEVGELLKAAGGIGCMSAVLWRE